MKYTFEGRTIKEKRKGLTFVDGKLIHPLPNVKFGGRLRTEPEFIELAIIKFSYSSVIDAIYNQKIILVL